MTRNEIEALNDAQLDKMIKDLEAVNMTHHALYERAAETKKARAK